MKRTTFLLVPALTLIHGIALADEPEPPPPPIRTESEPTAPRTSALGGSLLQAAPQAGASEVPSVSPERDPALDASASQSGDYAPTASRRRFGLYMSGSLGGGAHRLESRASGWSASVQGDGPAFALHVGGTVRENVILHATLTSSLTEDPELSSAGSDVTLRGFELRFAGFGAGVTYYVMPANVYLGASLLFTRASIDGPGNDMETDLGIGSELRVGKEFWVGDELALGFGVQAFGAMMDGELPTEDVQTGSLNVFFNATYN